MIQQIHDSAIAAVQDRLLLSNHDLNGWPIYEDPFVADMYSSLRQNGHLCDVFRKGFAPAPQQHHDIVLLGEANWAVEVKLWVNEQTVGAIASEISSDITKIRNGSCVHGAVVVWVADDVPPSPTNMNATRTSLGMTLGLQNMPSLTGRLPAQFNGAPCATEIWTWQVT